MNVALLLVLALPEDPAVALEQLGRFGPMPECQVEEKIEKTEHDHAHRFAPPRAIPALEGAYAELLPFVEHSNRKVVLRAVSLMCRTGSPLAPAQVLAVAKRWPCESELGRSAAAMALAPTGIAPCKEPPEAPWRATARAIGKWKQPAQAAAVKAISAGDAKQLERTLWDLEALDPARARAALATLAQVDAPTAFLPTMRALHRFLGNRVSLDPLVAGVLGAQLSSIATRRSLTRPAAFCAVAATASVEDLELLRSLSHRRELFEAKELSKAADVARRGKDLTAFGREYLEDLANEEHDWMDGRKAISKMVDYRDRPALRAYLADDANGLRDRLYAATELGKLGDGTGLTLFASADGLWPDAYKERRQLLIELSASAPAPLREQVQALLAKSWPQP